MKCGSQDNMFGKILTHVTDVQLLSEARWHLRAGWRTKRKNHPWLHVYRISLVAL